MASVKLTKNELKRQKDNLKQFVRYLPTLQLKKQQLQSVIMKVEKELEIKQRKYDQMVNGFDEWVGVFAENGLFTKELKVENLVKPDTVICTESNIAGIVIPEFKELTFKDISYNVEDYPLWVDKAVIYMREIASLKVLLQTLKRQIEILNNELRLTSQRVNLFEKVKIPETKENIRVIQIYLGDQQTSAVVRGKIAKQKRQVTAV